MAASSANFYYFWDYWNLGHKVTFDGSLRTITVNPGVTEISVKTDIYSDWKEWAQVDNNSQFLPALRVTGGDPIGVGEFTGDVYFLINNWRIVVDHSCVIDGVIYSDDYPSPFVQIAGTQLVTNKVSQLVQTVAPVVENLSVTVDPLAPTVQQIRQEMDSNSTQLSNIWTSVQTIESQPDAPNVIQIREEIDANSTQLANIWSSVQIIEAQPAPSAEEVADAVRVELAPELAHILTLSNSALSPAQSTMILEMYTLLGLDPTQPLIVTNTARTAGNISQSISTSSTETVVSRNP